LPAKNDDALCLTNRGAQFAGKPRSYRGSGRLLEPGLPAKNDNPVRLTNRGAQFAGKPRSYRKRVMYLVRKKGQSNVRHTGAHCLDCMP